MFVKMLILFSFRYIRKIFSRWNLRNVQRSDENLKIWFFGETNILYIRVNWNQIFQDWIHFSCKIFATIYACIYFLDWQWKVSRFAGTRIVYSRMEIRSLECAIFKGYARFKQATTVNFRFTTEQWFPICRSS